MAKEIGAYYVSLLPSGQGFEKAAKGQAESAFQGAEKTSKGFFSKLAGWAKTGAVVVGGMVAAVGGLAVGGGIARALNIEDATAKLKGLGNDTKTVEAIMKDALASVKGTAFGLDAAATTAASAVAAGIKPGQELERYLRLTADAATIAGVSMEEMGSIINQVTSKGYAGMENLNRLTERGIPILQWLADEYGVTADELSKMVSRGEVDAETFRKVIEDNIGGAALASGDTTRGAVANMMAALSRLGEAFVGEGLAGAKTFFTEVTVILDGLNDRLGSWIKNVQDRFGALGEMEGFGGRFLEGLDAFVSNFDATPLGLLLSALLPLVPVFKEIGAKVGPALADTFEEIFDVLGPLLPLLGEALVDAVTELAGPFTDLFVALLPLLPPLLELVTELLPPLTDLLLLIVPFVADVVAGIADLAEVFSAMVDVMSGDTTLVDFGQQMLDIGGPISEFSRWIMDMVSLVTSEVWRLGDIWNEGWKAIGSVISTMGTNIVNKAKEIWTALPAEFRSGVERAVGFVGELPGRVLGAIGNAGSWLVESGKSLIRGFIDGIKSMMKDVGDAVGGVMDFAAGFFPRSPAKRGPFSGAGWWAVADGGASLMEQFTFGAEAYKADVSFANITGIVHNSRSESHWPTELVVRDVNDELIGRMGIEADRRVGANASSVDRGVKHGRWSDA